MRGRPSNQPAAQEWLEAYLSSTPKGMRFAEEVKVVGAVKGYGWLTLKRAKKALGYKSLRSDNKWLWFNPYHINPDQPSLAEATASKIEQIAKDATATVNLAEARLQDKRDQIKERVKAKINKTGWSDVTIANAARAQARIASLDKGIAFIQEAVKQFPLDPPFTDEEVAQIVREEYQFVADEIDKKKKAGNATTANTGWTDAKIATTAKAHASTIPIERSVALIQDWARKSPADQVYTDEEIALMVREAYDDEKKKTARPEF